MLDVVTSISETKVAVTTNGNPGDVQTCDQKLYMYTNFAFLGSIVDQVRRNSTLTIQR